MFRLHNLTKSFGDRTLFSDVSFAVGEGMRIGMVGPNGSGKSTLLRIIAGLEEPDSGLVELLPHRRVRYLPQSDHDAERGNAASGGERQRRLLRTLLDDGADMFLLDEPTNNLDQRGIADLTQELMHRTEALLIVSHDRDFLDIVVDRILEIDPLTAKCTLFGGNFSSYELRKKQGLERQWRLFTVQERKISQLKNDIGETKKQALTVENGTVNDYVRGRSKKVAAKAKARESRLMRMVAAENKIDKPRERQLIRCEIAESKLRGVCMLEFTDVGYSVAGKDILSEVSLGVLGGQHILLTGNNGAGKSTLMRLIAGELQSTSGRIWRNNKAHVCYLPQSLLHLPSNEKLIDWFQEQLQSGDICNRNSSAMRTYLHRFLFAGDDVFKLIQQLSCGERMRLQLAAFIANSPDMILLDEPTNHMDLDAIQSIEQALSEYKGTIIAISHDRAFQNYLQADQQWFCADGKVAAKCNL